MFPIGPIRFYVTRTDGGTRTRPTAGDRGQVVGCLPCCAPRHWTRVQSGQVGEAAGFSVSPPSALVSPFKSATVTVSAE